MAVNAQPYLDVVKLSYYHSPSTGTATGITTNIHSVNATLPIELKKGGDAIIINPFFDQNHATTGATDLRVRSVGGMAGFLKKNIISKWDLMTSIIVRRNQEVDKDLKNNWQAGGLILATFKQNESRSFKIGAYYNREFFGNFFMPLLGIDWKINESTSLFGVLPGSMTLERKVRPGIYMGASFRALTNSYRLPAMDPCFSGDCSGNNYLRINDNQLGVFADIYFFKRIVVSAEGGHTILRKYRLGFKGATLHTYTDIENNNWYLRASLSYRLRFTGR